MYYILLSMLVIVPDSLCPLAKNRHGNETDNHGGESGKHLVRLGIPKRAIDKIGRQQFEGSVELTVSERIIKMDVRGYQQRSS
jgi:hypothetical protein